MKDYELNKILELHQKWLNAEEGGVRANLQGVNLQGIDLHKADLRGANLCGADLRESNLCEANLSTTNLWEANLHKANLYEANLSEAILYGANLFKVNLCKANLCETNLSCARLFGANLSETNLYKTNLWRADLRWSNLCKANLLGSNLRNADLRGADLREAKLQETELYGACLWEATNIPYIPLACPERGSFTAFKKCGEYIVELLIPADAKRSSATTRKCRASYAKVLSITTLDGEIAKTDKVMNSIYSSDTVYKVGEYVYPDAFDENRWYECSHGIHFFVNRQEAVEY